MRQKFQRVRRQRDSGFSLVELCVTLGIAIVMAAVAMPVVRSTLASYRLRSAVNAVNAAVQKTRYRAIAAGYPFALVINRNNSSLQVQSDPTDTNKFASVGSAIPFASEPMLGQSATLVFRPGGAIQCPQCTATQTDAKGNWLLTLTHGSMPTETMTISPYGQINVTP